MKKILLFAISALALTACDLSNFGPARKGGGNSDHHGVSLLMKCSDGATIATHRDGVFMDSLDLTSITLYPSTVKRLDGKITFYQPPVFGQGQLQELPKDIDNPMHIFEMDIDFKGPSNQEIDFVYLNNISWTAKEQDSIINKYLRLAIYTKEDSGDCFVFSSNPEGETSKTEYNLDLNMDGQLDKAAGFEWEEAELVTYTTGMPIYCTDPYYLAIPSENEINSDKFDPLHACMKTDKQLTVRIWVEGWELSNNDALEEKDIEIELGFIAHIAK